MSPSKGKLKSLTIKEKLELIEEVEYGGTVKEVAERNGIHKNTLHYILKSRDKIREKFSVNPNLSSFKRIKQTKSPELERKILAYMYSCRDKNLKLSGNIIKNVALEIAAGLGIDSFAASNGWLFSFFKRNKISISDFNKGIDPCQEALKIESSFLELEPESSEPPFDVTEETEIHQEIQYEEVEDEYYAEISKDEETPEEVYETEMIQEYEEEGAGEVELLEQEESLWYNWCRMCGRFEGLPEIDEEHATIVSQLIQIPFDNVKLCHDCDIEIGGVAKMVSNGRNVKKMFQKLENIRKAGTLTDDQLQNIRCDFGVESEEKVLLETSEIWNSHDLESNDPDTIELMKYEEEPEAYEAVEDISMDETVEQSHEHVEYDTEEQNEVIEEEIQEPETEKLQKNYADKIPDDTFEYQCHICAKRFDRMYYLSNHTRDLHNTMPRVECSCGRFLATWDSLMAHKRKHSNLENGFACDYCPATFRTKTGLSIHIKFKHERPGKEFVCKTCGRQFNNGSVLKAHLRVHLPDEEKFAFECEICGKKMVNKWSLKYHISTIHELNKNHFCKVCGKAYGNKSNLRSHLISHSTEKVSCDICHGVFKNIISLQSHKKMHKPKHLRKYTCDTCNKKFDNQNHLNRHLISHSEVRRHKCPYTKCTAEYKWPKDLTNHIAGVHTGERPFKCDWCDKTFVDQSNCRKHKLKAHPKEIAATEGEYGQYKGVVYIVPEYMNE